MTEEEIPCVDEWFEKQLRTRHEKSIKEWKRLFKLTVFVSLFNLVLPCLLYYLGQLQLSVLIISLCITIFCLYRAKQMRSHYLSKEKEC